MNRGLYVLDKLKVLATVVATIDFPSFHFSLTSSSFYLWHSHLSHVSSSH